LPYKTDANILELLIRRQNQTYVKYLLSLNIPIYIDLNAITIKSEDIRNIIYTYMKNPKDYIYDHKTNEIIDVYRLVIFFSNEYFQLSKNDLSDEEMQKSYTFFNIITKLPVEMQTKIIYLTVNYEQLFVRDKYFNYCLRFFIKKYAI
jgi:endo-1,4-beta-D-glucanase Y